MPTPAELATGSFETLGDAQMYVDFAAKSLRPDGEGDPEDALSEVRQAQKELRQATRGLATLFALIAVHNTTPEDP